MSDNQFMQSHRVAQDILKRRMEQVTKHGYTVEHDDRINQNGSLTRAAISFLTLSQGREYDAAQKWPNGWGMETFRRGVRDGARENLITAAALIISEIESLDRFTERAGGSASLSLRDDALLAVTLQSIRQNIEQVRQNIGVDILSVRSGDGIDDSFIADCFMDNDDGLEMAYLPLEMARMRVMALRRRGIENQNTQPPEIVFSIYIERDSIPGIFGSREDAIAHALGSFHNDPSIGLGVKTFSTYRMARQEDGSLSEPFDMQEHLLYGSRAGHEPTGGDK